MDLEILNKAKELMIPNSTSVSLVKNQSDELDWKYFIEMMVFLQSVKRDKLPDEVIKGWFRIFKDKGWTKTKFDTQYQKVLSNPSYGVVKIDEFFNEETLYTETEVARMIEMRINDITRQGERLLENKELNRAEYLNLQDDYIKLAITKKLKFQQYNDQQDMYEAIIDRAIEIAKQEILSEPKNKEA